MILSNYSPNEEDLQNEEFLELNQEASDLYGLTHARFIISQRGTCSRHGLYSACMLSAPAYRSRQDVPKVRERNIRLLPTRTVRPPEGAPRRAERRSAYIARKGKKTHQPQGVSER